jgi:hypothetical protein
MRLKLALAFLSCLVVFVYTSNAKQKQSQPQALNKQETYNPAQLTTTDLSRQKQQQWQDFQQSQAANTQLKTPIPINPHPFNHAPLETPSPFPQPIQSPQPNAFSPLSQENYMTLTPTNTTNAVGNPIYELRLYGNGQLIAVYPTVTGKATTQSKNRHQEGTEAPLPDGKYSVASGAIPGTDPEVGELFLPIEPLFSTGRTALGIHYDPSFQKSNGEDGTQGCIALTQKQDLDEVLYYVNIYQPQYIEVKLQT